MVRHDRRGAAMSALGIKDASGCSSQKRETQPAKLPSRSTKVARAGWPASASRFRSARADVSAEAPDRKRIGCIPLCETSQPLDPSHGLTVISCMTPSLLLTVAGRPLAGPRAQTCDRVSDMPQVQSRPHDPPSTARLHAPVLDGLGRCPRHGGDGRPPARAVAPGPLTLSADAQLCGVRP